MVTGTVVCQVTEDAMHATRRTRIGTAAGALVLVTSACTGATADGQATGPADAATTASVQLVDDALTSLTTAASLRDDPFTDYDEAVDVTVRIQTALAELLDAIAASGDPDLADLATAAEQWSAEAADVQTELSERRDELEPANVAWAASGGDAGPEGPPPAPFTAVLDRALLEGRDDFSDACAAWAVAVDAAVDCYRLAGPPPEGSTDDLFAVGDGAINEVIVVGDVQVRVRASGIFGAAVRPDGVTIDPDQPGPLTIGTPPDVAAGGDAAGTTQPWPSDLAAWASELPVDIALQTSESLASGEWEVVAISADEALVLTELDSGEVVVAEGGLPVLFAATVVEGTTIAAVSASPTSDFEGFLGYTMQVLGALEFDE